LYADDIKLYSAMKTVNDCKNLQESLDVLYNWSCAWQLSISCKKCSFMDIGKLKNEKDLSFRLGDNNIISRQETAKDLGICTDSGLKFSSHISQVVAKTHARASVIHKCFLSKNILVKAYVAYVRPLLEYAVCVWSPYQLDDVAKIKSVQRRFTKRLPGLSNTSYSDRLAVLGLSLQLRRLHQDLIYTYKIIFGLVDLDCLKFFLISPNETTRGHAL